MNLNFPNKFLQVIFIATFLVVGCNEQHTEISAEILPVPGSEDMVLQIIREGKSYEFSIKSLVDDISALPFGRIEIVSDLDLDGEPEVVLDITTEGAYCCTIFVVLYFDETNQQYQISNQLIKNWGLTPKLVDVDEDNKPEFVTRNYDFIWLTTPTASISPIQLFRFEAGQIVDLTNEYPHFVEQDAQLWLAILRNQVPELDENYLQLPHVEVEYLFTEERLQAEEIKQQIIIPTYLADMYLLGRFDEGWENVDGFCQNETCKDYLTQIRESIMQK